MKMRTNPLRNCRSLPTSNPKHFLTSRSKKETGSGLLDYFLRQSKFERPLRSLNAWWKASDRTPSQRIIVSMSHHTSMTSSLSSLKICSMNYLGPNHGIMQWNLSLTPLQKVARSTHFLPQSKRSWTPFSRKTSILVGFIHPNLQWPPQSSLLKRRMANSVWWRTTTR